MKKLFIGLLIAAAGVAAFFLLRKQNKEISENNFQKEQLIGSWKLDSLDYRKDSGSLLPNILVLPDSNLTKYRYEFTKDHAVFISSGDSLTSDSARYVWNQNEVIFSHDSTGLAADSLTVIRLRSDSLVLRDRDSALFYFTKRE